MNNRFKRLIYLAFCLLLVVGGAEAKKYKPINEIPGQVPETDEERGIWQVGLAHQKQVRGSAELVNNAQLEEYLESVVEELMGRMVDEIGLEVDVLVFRDSTVNAWVYPNGTVAVQTGLLAALKNEAQLAAILGHEVSHFLNRHAFIQIKAKQKQSLVGKGLGVLATAAVAAKTGAVNTGLLNSGQIWTDLVTSGYSRKLETRADQQGLELMMAAGYPPEQSIPAFETMRISDDDQVNIAKMWSSHPDIDARKKNLSKQIKKAPSSDSRKGLNETTYLQAVSLAVLSNYQLLMDGRQFASAIEGLSRFTQVLPNESTGHYLLGEALRRQTPEQNFASRNNAYLKAIEKNPSLAEAHRELGLSYRQQGQTDKARIALSEYLAQAPTSPDAPIIKWYLENLDQAVPASQGSGGFMKVIFKSLTLLLLAAQFSGLSAESQGRLPGYQQEDFQEGIQSSRNDAAGLGSGCWAAGGNKKTH